MTGSPHSASRKISQSYNSTEFSFAVTLDLTAREGASPKRGPEIIEEWSEKLRASIRQEFSRTNGRRALALASTDPVARTETAADGVTGKKFEREMITAELAT